MDVLDRMGHQGHPEEDYLERYIMRTCSERETNAIEEHLLICEPCRGRMEAAEEWVSLMKSALPLGPMRKKKPRWRIAISELFSRPIALTAGCAAMIAFLLSVPLLLREPAYQVISLSALRGSTESAVIADTRHLLHLRLDLTDLVEPLQGQVVDETGAIIWTQTVSRESPQLMLKKPLKPGTYWVRVNSGTGNHEPLREYSLKVQ